MLGHRDNVMTRKGLDAFGPHGRAGTPGHRRDTRRPGGRMPSAGICLAAGATRDGDAPTGQRAGGGGGGWASRPGGTL